MKRYLLIIFICMIIIFGFDFWLARPIFEFSAGYIALGVVLNTLFCMVIDIIIAVIIYFCIPKKWFNPFSKFFNTYKFEKPFYEKIGIRKWKDKIPSGIGFKKNQVMDIHNNDYVYLFIKDSCMAEVEHFLSIFLGFAIIFIYPIKYIWCFAFPVGMVNAVLNLLPVLVQRYNRPKLKILFERNLKTCENSKKN